MLFPFGSPNTTGVGSLCFVSYGMIAPRSCFGQELPRPVRGSRPGRPRARLGRQSGHGVAAGEPRPPEEAQARGGRVVVIDPRRSETARALRAEWIGIRPGTDGALALGMLHVLIDERPLRPRVRRALDARLRRAGRHGGVHARASRGDHRRPGERVRELARAVGAASGFSILMYTGLEYSNSGVQAIRAALTLQAIAGHLDGPGGKLIDSPERRPPAPALTAGAGRKTARDRLREFPVFHEVRREAHGALLPRRSSTATRTRCAA